MAGLRPAAVGFDFGTSTTMVAYGAKVRRMSSVVGYDATGSLVVGEAAVRLERSLRSIKRAITEGRERVRVGRLSEAPEEPADPLMVELLAEAVRRAAEAGVPVTKPGVVRLGCPAMWTARKRHRLVAIARQAGLPVTLDSLVDEPVAAGIAWLAGDKAQRPDHFRMLVFDMGGGTLDIAVIDVYEHREVAVLAATGIAKAGDTLDDLIADDLKYLLGVRIDRLDNPMSAIAELRDAARDIKEQLSTVEEAVFTFSRRYFNSQEVWYNRLQLEEVFHPLLDEAVMAVGRALRLAKLTEREPETLRKITRTKIEDAIRSVDVVVLAGGMAHVPYLQTRLEVMFGVATEVVHAYPPADDPSLVRKPEEAIAVGLAQADRFGRINVLRPAMDIQLTVEGRAEPVSLFKAYTSLMGLEQARIGVDRFGRLVAFDESDDFRHTRTGDDLDLPATGEGTIRVVSHNGRPVKSTLDGRSLDGFPVKINGNEFEFSLYPYGWIRLVDGAGVHDGQFDDWHIVG